MKKTTAKKPFKPATQDLAHDVRLATVRGGATTKHDTPMNPIRKIG